MATNATKAGWPMAGSPALKIVRHRKRDDKNGEPVVARKKSGRDLAVVSSDGPLPFTMIVAEIARELRVSAKSIRRMHEAGKLPRPVLVGTRSLRWVRQTIVEWLAAGCPDREMFEAKRKVGE